MKFGKALRHRTPSLDADLRAMEAADPKLAELGERIDNIGRALAGEKPARREHPAMVRNRADVTREAEAKRRREEEAERWIAEVRARKAKR